MNFHDVILNYSAELVPSVNPSSFRSCIQYTGSKYDVGAGIILLYYIIWVLYSALTYYNVKHGRDLIKPMRMCCSLSLRLIERTWPVQTRVPRIIRTRRTWFTIRIAFKCRFSRNNIRHVYVNCDVCTSTVDISPPPYVYNTYAMRRTSSREFVFINAKGLTITPAVTRRSNV